MAIHSHEGASLTMNGDGSQLITSDTQKVLMIQACDPFRAYPPRHVTLPDPNPQVGLPGEQIVERSIRSPRCPIEILGDNVGGLKTVVTARGRHPYLLVATEHRAMVMHCDVLDYSSTARGDQDRML